MAVSAAGLYAGLWRGFIDLEVYRAGARTLLDGYPVYGPGPLAGGPGLPFTYPPPALLLFIPLVVLPAGIAHGLFFATSVTALAGVLWIVLRALAPGREPMTAVAVAVVAATACLFLEPISSTLGYGQINLVLLLLITLDTLTAARHWPRGLLLGFAVAIKLTPVVFLLFFIVRRDRRTVVVTVVTAVATIGAAWLAAPTDSTRYWFHAVWDTGRIGAPWYANNQSLNGALARLPLTGAWETALWLGLSVVALVLAAAWMRRLVAAGDAVSALLVNALLVLLISPVSWTHHWVWIAPALLVLGDAAYRGAPRGGFGAAGAGAAGAGAAGAGTAGKVAAGKVAAGIVTAWKVTAGLAAAGLAVAVVFVAGPSWRMPIGDDRELAWTWQAHIVGNAYTLLGVAALITGGALALRAAAARRAGARRAAARRAAATPVSHDSGSCD